MAPTDRLIRNILEESEVVPIRNILEESELVAIVIIILFPSNSEVVLMQHLASMIPMDAAIGMDQRPWESSHPGIACIRPASHY